MEGYISKTVQDRR